MRRATLLPGLLCALSASGATLTFEQALARAEARALPSLPENALRILEHAPRFEWPSVRAEGTLSNASSIDVFNDSAIVSVDVPLFDGGALAIRRRIAMLDAAAFRERMRERADEVFTATLDAVARLYTAQERRKILQTGLQRSLGMRDRAGQLLTVREISGLTAAQWQDEAIAAESELIDLDLQHLDAETRLKQLIGDTTSEPIEITLSLNDHVPARQPGNSATLAAQRQQLAFEEARAARRTHVTISAFGGIASVPADRYALYGLRMTIALPMFDAAAQRREAQARLEAAEAEMARDATIERARRQESILSLNAAGLAKRIELLERAVDVARQRADSVTRLASAGLRSEATVAGAIADVGRRESDLLAARVELWKQKAESRSEKQKAESRKQK